MRAKILRPVLIAGSLLLVWIALLALPGRLAPLSEGASAQERIRRAWDLAAASGTYQYRANVDQAAYPQASLRNAGQSVTRDQVSLTGSIDQPNDLVELSLARNGGANPQDAVAIRVTAGQTLVRQGLGEWQASDNATDAFAPGGDPLGWLESAVDVRLAGVEERRFGDDLALSFGHYTFKLDGPAFARQMGRKLEAQLRARGELPAGMSLDSPAIYADMAGSGEIWLDSDGLPRRLTMRLDLPAQADSGPIRVDLSADFFDFDRSRLALAATRFSDSPGAWVAYRLSAHGRALRALAFDASVCMLLAALLLLAVRVWRSRRFQTALVGAVIASMLITPALQASQVSAFAERQQERAALQEEQAAAAAADPRAILGGDPHQNPLAAAAPGHRPPAAGHAAAAAAADDGTDTDGDGLTDVEEVEWDTCPSAASADEDCDDVADPTDTDGDGLEDGVEIHTLLTVANHWDTDSDGITDTLEVQGFVSGGKTWYLKAYEADSNLDGMTDGAECAVWTAASSKFNPSAACPDSDGDGQPDVWDDDNDNDGVVDAVDLSPATAGSQTYNDSNPLELSLTNLQPDLPVFVDLQFRPTDADQLTYIGNVLDWPTGDTEGQIQRRNETTFASTSNADIVSSDANAAYGDVRVTPVLQISIPFRAGHYGNLPVKAAYRDIPRTQSMSADLWVDSDVLDPYGVSVIDADETSGDLIAYVPLSVVSDDTGGGRSAFSARMLYWPTETGGQSVVDWGDNHEYRVIWLVQMITDEEVCATVNNAVSCSRQDSLDVIHIYDDEAWKMTGLDVREDHGLEVGIVYEEPSLDADLTQDDDIWEASWRLNNTFLRGRDCDSLAGDVCQSDGQRDVTIANLADSLHGWSGGGDALQVRTFSYDHQGYISQILMTETLDLLDDRFTASADATDPTLLFAREETYRSANADELAGTAGAIALDFGAATAPEMVLASLSWATYRYDSGSWANYDSSQNLDRLSLQLAGLDFFQAAGGSDDSQEEAEGKLLWAQSYYASLEAGLNTVVELGGVVSWTPASGEVTETVYAATLVPGLSVGPGLVAFTFLAMIQHSASSYGSASYWQSIAHGFTNTYATQYLRLKYQNAQVFSNVLMGVATSTTIVGMALYAYGSITGESVYAEVGQYILQGTTVVVSVVLAANLLTGLRNLQLVTGLAANASTFSKMTSLSWKNGAIGPAGLLIGLVVTWGMFAIQGWQSGLFSSGSSLEINAALAYMVASTIVQVIMFIIDLIPVVGPFIVLAIYIADVFMSIFCKKTCHGGVQAWLTEVIADSLYEVDNLITNLDSPDRLDFDVIDVSILDPEEGYSTANAISYTLAVTNVIAYDSSYSNADATRATFRYFLRTSDDDQHSEISRNQMRDEWDNLAGRKIRTVANPALPGYLPFSRVGSGLNRDLGGEIYLVEAYAAPYTGCWMFAGIHTDCEWFEFTGSNPIDIGEYLIYDLLPGGLSEFYGIGWSGQGAMNFGGQIDHDQDGLLAASGADPNDDEWDSDGDGLSDYYELSNLMNAQSTDSDGDGLGDTEEVRRDLAPSAIDGDDDGLSDWQEWTGWQSSYYNDGAWRLTWVWSDPFVADADSDRLDDREEFYYGLNPWEANGDDDILNTITFEDAALAEQNDPRLLLRLEESAGAVAFVDRSGANGAAVCQDVCPTAGASGRYGNGLELDGTQAISIGLDYDFSNARFTQAAWIRPAAADQWYHGIMGAEPAGAVARRGPSLFVYQQTKLYFGFGNGTTWKSSITGPVLTAGAWNHVAATFDGTTYRIYVNGAEVYSTTAHAGRTPYPVSALDVGQASVYTFEGGLDEVAVYDFTMSAAQIGDLAQAKYNVTDNIVSAGQVLDYSLTVNNNSPVWPAQVVYYDQPDENFTGFEPSGPRGEWALDDASAASLSDSSGNGYSGTCSGSACPTAGVSGYRNTALQFDGNDQVTLDAAVQSWSGTGFSFGGWVYPTAAGGSRYQYVATLMKAGTGTASSDVLNSISYDTQDHYFTGGSAGTTGQNSAPANAWYHVMVVVDTVSGAEYVYLNGERKMANIYGDTPPSGARLRLGGPAAGTVGNFYGKIDEFTLYNRILSASEVQQAMAGDTTLDVPVELPSSVYAVARQSSQDLAQSVSIPSTQPSGPLTISQLAEAALDITDERSIVSQPVFRAHFGETRPNSSSWYYQAYPDTVVYSCSGTCPAMNSGLAGVGLEFAGTENGVGWTANIANKPWTLGAWIYPTQTSGAKRGIIGARDGSGSPALFITSAGALGLGIPTSAGWNETYTAGGSVSANSWSHVAATYDGAGNFQVYLNGAAVGDDNAMSANKTPTSGSSSSMGNIGTGFTTFKGKLDNVTAYDVALTAKQVSALSSMTDLALHAQYGFDEPPGDTTFSDAAAVYADATCTSCPTLGIRGKVNRAARFDGNDKVLSGSLPNYWRGESIGYSSDFTVAVWVKAQQGVIVENKSAKAPFKLWTDRYDFDKSSGSVVVGTPYYYDDIFVNDVLSPADWNHIIATYDHNNIQSALYINGVKIKDLNQGSPYEGNGSNPLWIGEYLDGYLDDVRLYDRWFSAADALALYQTSAPQLQLEFEEDTTATSFDDESSNNADGTSVQAVPGLAGRVGNGVLFNGDGYVEIGNDDPITGLSSGFTAMTWVRPATTSGIQTLISSGLNTASGKGWKISLSGQSLLFSRGGQILITTQPVILAETWQQVAFVLDSSNNGTFYVDGVAVANTYQTAGALTANTAGRLLIGAAATANGVGSYFSGQLDELMIYSRALNGVEIDNAYTNQFRWFRKQYDTRLMVDNDTPVITLLSDEPHWPNEYVQLTVSTTDASSPVWSFEYGLKAPGAAAFTWQSAPSCADAAAGELWCPAFDPTALGGEGAYQLQFRAVDGVGNETTSPISTIYVDGTPPSAASAYNATRLDLDSDPANDQQWSLALSGTISDPALSGGSAGSGVDPASLSVALLDQAGAIAGTGLAQPASLSGAAWSVEYRFVGTRPIGAYDLQISASDAAGNAATMAAGSVILDARAPSVDIAGWDLPGALISSTLTLSGTLSEQPAPAGAQLRLHFEDAAAQLFRDSSGQALDATCVACPSAAAGLFGQALVFSAAAQTLLTVPATSALELSAGTLSAWIKPTWAAGSPAANPTILAMAGAGGTRYSWQIGADYQSMLIGNGSSTFAVPVSLAADQWHHVAVVQAGAEWTGYVDGVAVGSASQAFGGASGQPLLIGGDGASFFAGQLDEVAVYDRALGAAEIYALGQRDTAGLSAAQTWLEPADLGAETAGRVSGFAFEDTPGDFAFANDSGLTSAACAACPAPTAGLFGQALTFSSTGKTHLTMPATTALDLTQATFSAWIKPTWASSTHNPTILALRDPSGVRYSWHINKNYQAMELWNGATVGSVPVALSAGQWYHIALVQAGSRWTGYVDGVAVGSVDQAFGAATGLPLQIGSSTGLVAFWIGDLDQIAIYDRPLSAAEIAGLADRRRASTWAAASLASQSGQLATWRSSVPDGLEDFYRLRIRGVDAAGNTSPGRVVWNGSVDTLAPRVSLSARNLGAGSAARTEYTFAIDDLFLDQSSLDQPCLDGQLIPGYDSASGRLEAIGATCRVAGHSSGTVSVTACDYAGHCTTASASVQAAADPASVAILTPPAQSRLIVSAPISISGGAYAPAGVQSIAIAVNGSPLASLAGAGIDQAWTAAWTPAAVGTYTITATLTDAASAVRTDSVVVTVAAARSLTISKLGSGSGSVASSPAGIACGAVCAQSYADGTTVTLAATPDAESTFAGWGGACAGSAGTTCRITLSEASAVTATFNSASGLWKISLPRISR